MIDAHTLAYDRDEEQGFAEPARQPAVPLGAGHKLALAVTAVGVLNWTMQSYGGPLWGTWLGMLVSYGFIGGGLAAAFWLAARGTHPGIKHDGIKFAGLTARGAPAWIAGILMTTFYVLIYLYPRYIGGMVRTVDPLALAITGHAADRWFLYGFLYTVAVLVFGVRMIMKYRHNRYQIVRTLSVMFFQLVFAFALPHLLVLFQQPEFYFTYFWPLKFQYLWPSDLAALRAGPGLGVFFAYWAVIMAFAGVPVLTYFLGKRWYCSWVCGCGGLAETLGDPFRQLSDKSTRAWKIERWMIHSVLVFVTLTTALLWINSASEGAVLGSASQTFAEVYGFAIGMMFAGVVGVGFYPLLGNRVWCRFGCPQAAILGLFQRFFSRFRITTNGGQCMSCGNCSTYCEMGIDVRSYAQNRENIIRASCVGCGVCAAVCPRGVLKLENGSTFGDRYEGSDQPVQAFLRSLSHEPK